MADYCRHLRTVKYYEDYPDAINRENAGEPFVINMSHEKLVKYYENLPVSWVTCVYDVKTTEEPTKIANPIGYVPSKMIVDNGREVDAATGYTFSTLGEHTVKFKLRSFNEIKAEFDGVVDLISFEVAKDVEYLAGFSSCDGLTDVNIPDTVNCIGLDAFRNCSNLKNVTIGKGVLQIREMAFNKCTSLENVIILGDMIPSLVQSATFGAIGHEFNLYVKDELVETCKTMPVWRDLTYAVVKPLSELQ